VRWGLRVAALLLGVSVAAAGTAWAQQGERPDRSASDRAVRATLMLTHLSNRSGGIDPRARRLDERLQRENIRFPSARVLKRRSVDLKLDRIETLALPDGRAARFRPMHVGERGVLMAVDVDGGVKMDARVRNGHMVVIDGGRFEDGKLVISIEPDYD
jgi:hypothetical protein